MSKTQDAINETVDLLNQELLNDELLQEELDEQNARLRSNTQVCEEEGYDFIAGKKMPQTYQCGGIANSGKYMRVDYDGYIRPFPGPQGQGYEPDFTTIGLTSDSTLAVIDYISSTEAHNLVKPNPQVSPTTQPLEAIEINGEKYKIKGGYEPDYLTINLDTNNRLYVVGYVNKIYVDGQITVLDNSLKQWVEDNYCPESFAVELDERLHTAEETITELTPKVERALLIPLATPISTELVGVGTDKEQKRVKLGYGLSYDTTTDTLSAPANRRYLHDIFALIQSQGSIEYFGEFHVYIINNNPNPMNASEVFFANGFISPVCKYTHQRGASLMNDNKLGIFRERDRVKSGGGIIGNKNLVFEVQGWNKDIEMNEITEIFLAQTADVSYLSSEKYFVMLDQTLEDTVCEI